MKPPDSPPSIDDAAWLAHFLRLERAKAMLLAVPDSNEFPLRKVRTILSDAGFTVRVVVKHECHELWEARMKIGIFDLSSNLRLAARQIRRLLVLGGIPTGEVIVNRSKEYVKIAFLSPLGVPGVLNGTELTLGLSSATSP